MNLLCPLSAGMLLSLSGALWYGLVYYESLSIIVVICIGICFSVLLRSLELLFLDQEGTLTSNKNRFSQRSQFYIPFLLLGLSPIAVQLDSLFLFYVQCGLFTFSVMYQWGTLRSWYSGEKSVSCIAGTLTFLYMVVLFFFFQNNIVHDAFQYYAYLRSFIIDFDVNVFNELFHFNSDRFYNNYPHYSSRYIGTCLFLSPFFIVGHGIAHISGLFGEGFSFIPDGYSLPYRLSVSLGSSLYGFLAVLLSIRLSRMFVSAVSSIIGAVIVMLGTPLFFFMFQWNGWAHTPSVLAVSIFFLHARWMEKEQQYVWQHFMLQGMVLALMTIIRPPNILYGTLILFDLYFTTWLKRGELSFFRMFFNRLFSSLLGFLPIIMIQSFYWKSINGSFFVQPYKEVGDYFSWFSPQLFQILFSVPRHGLFTWTPLVAVSLVGLFFLRRSAYRYVLIYGVLFLQQLYLYASWSIWWTGVGFSNRFFISCTPILVVGLSALIERCRNFRCGFAAIMTLCIFLVTFNIFFIMAYRTDSIPMGIASPQRVVNEELTLDDIYETVLNDMPRQPATVIQDFWINENFFAARVLNAVSTISFGRLFLIVAVLVILSVLVFWISHWGLGESVGALMNNQIIAVFLVLMLLSSITLSSLFIVAGSGFSRVENIHLVPGNFFTITSPNKRELFVNYREEVNHLDVISYLIYSGNIPAGTEIATVTVTDWDDRAYTLPLRVGIETAECSINRPEYKEELKHDIDRTKIVHRFTLKAYSRFFYTGYGYLSTLVLPHPLMIKKVLVTFVHSEGTLVVTDLIFSLRENNGQ